MSRELNAGDGCPEVFSARQEDAAAVGEILEDVRRWMASRGIAQWTEPFGEAWIGERIAAGEFHVARLGDAPVATLRLLWADPLFWGERDQGDAVYVHTMAVRRDVAEQGVGARLLGWAEGQARADERRFLRLDCDAGNPALTAYYRRLGFVERGTAEIGGMTVTLLEKALGA